MRYRADIEGLRGIAIAAVVAYHFAQRTAAGGYLGVDVFFVLSGHLITLILAEGLDSGRFSPLEFYRRRVVRILPALLTMLVIVCAAGVLLLLPIEARVLGASGAAAAGFGANLLFWSSSGYFDVSQVKPLLHTWSLGVEEQAYLLYPPVLWLLHRWLPGWRRGALVAATIASAALCWVVGRDHPEAAFYLLPTRAWELSLGGVAALGGLPRLRPGWQCDLAAAAGLALVLGSFALHLPADWPLVQTIPPCLGTALLLAYGERTAIARLVAVSPLRWLGRVSYSLYLWHFPVRELYRASVDPEPGVVASLWLLLTGFALALLSYYFVEAPVRAHFRTGGSAARVVIAGVSGAGLVALLCLGLAFAAPRLAPLPPAVARIAAYAEYKDGLEWRYQYGPVACRGGTLRYDFAHCLRIDPSRRNILVFGDSHGAQVWRAIAERFPHDNVVLAASTHCRPLFGSSGGRFCLEMIERVRREAIATRRVQAVVLAGNWGPENVDGIATTIAALRAAAVQVTLLGPVMQYRVDVPLLAAHALLGHGGMRPELQRSPWPPLLDPQLRAVAARTGARYYSMFEQECPANRCRLLTRGGVPMHFDQGHLTLEGARELVAALPEP